MKDYMSRGIGSLAASTAFGTQYAITESTFAFVLQIAFFATTVLYLVTALVKREF